MDQFELYKNQWQQQQPSDQELAIDDIRKKAQDDLTKHQRKLIFSNLFMSVSFAATIGMMVWIWNSMSDRSIYFYVSLIFIFVLLIVFAAIQWSGVQYKNIKPEINPKKFIDYSRKKLLHNRFTLKYGLPVYLFLLSAGLMMYFQDILVGGSLLFKVLAYGITFGYIIITSFFAYKKVKKKVKKIDELIAHLNEWEKIIKE
ncbi:hypothetical protein JKA74_16785 [Marivirga sp. S37H4]|uniref:Uncharacterized protein n=1 Tax=Marivirga aurantiaca TaxID=2802615 RepID=A0A934X114_9BACT|nr:hypothetical protein [Marivirga aurantiaca]MBK6266704.1 hypothetical protein [Marivirga aurantiaca]